VDWLVDETAGQRAESHATDLPLPTLNAQVQGSNPWARTRRSREREKGHQTGDAGPGTGGTRGAGEAGEATEATSERQGARGERRERGTRRCITRADGWKPDLRGLTRGPTV
jgi:hypothetical protein